MTDILHPRRTLDDIAHSSPLIGNCAGLGAHTLVPDNQVHPIRGHHVIVTNPGLTGFIEADTGDSPHFTVIYPHSGHVVLGGTTEPGKWDRDPDPATGQAILERCIRLEPRLADAQVIDHLVGLRPTRPDGQVDLQYPAVERPSPTTTATAEPASAPPGAAPPRSPTCSASQHPHTDDIFR